MTKRKSPKPTKSKIEIQTRTPSKGGIFDNIGANRSKERHPLKEIINFPQRPDSHTVDQEISKFEDSGYQESKSLDSQIINLGNPKSLATDSPPSHHGNPEMLNLDSQKENTGNPKTTSLDSLISKPEMRIAKKPEDLDSKLSASENADSQKTKKTNDWKKYDGARSRKGIFLRTDDNLTKRFKQFCIGQELEFSQGTELAWERFMADLDSQKAENLDSRIAPNNKQIIMMWKSKPIIINLYYQYNQFFTSRVRWTTKDDRTAQSYNDADPRIIELGIIQTQCNLFSEGIDKSTTINGFQYYANEIKKFMMYEDKPDILDTILKINRETWSKMTGKTVDYSAFEEK